MKFQYGDFHRSPEPNTEKFRDGAHHRVARLPVAERHPAFIRPVTTCLTPIAAISSVIVASSSSSTDSVRVERIANAFLDRALRRHADLFEKLSNRHVQMVFVHAADVQRGKRAAMLDDVSATSALVLPVFVAPDLHNFRGAGVDLAEVPLFRRMIEELLAPRLERAQKALIVPLGVAAATGVRHLCEMGTVADERVLAVMPHPSGSNGHRIPQFKANEASMRERIAEWFN